MDDGILELSTKCDPRDGFQVAAETRAWLTAQGIELGGTQQTKTRTALEFYAAELHVGHSTASHRLTWPSQPLEVSR